MTTVSIELLENLSDETKQSINRICNTSFNAELTRDYVAMVQKHGTYVSLLRSDGIVGGVAFLAGWLLLAWFAIKNRPSA